MKPIVAVIEWYGPYSLEEARTASFDYKDGFTLPWEKQRISALLDSNMLDLLPICLRD